MNGLDEAHELDTPGRSPGALSVSPVKIMIFWAGGALKSVVES